MDNAILFSLPQNETLGDGLTSQLGLSKGMAVFHDFPDGDVYVRIQSDVKNKVVIIVCSLQYPNNKVLPLMFLARTAKELGAKKVILVAPYLPFMRQDKRFHAGEALSAELFADFLSSFIDSLIAVDPHLHRIKKLSEIYNLEYAQALHAPKLIADWIQRHVKSPIIIGPDEESEQWVSKVAESCHAPYIINTKVRLGDKEVKITVPKIADKSKTPVLVDDIISTGVSMEVAIKQLLAQGSEPPICIGIHGIFSENAEQRLLHAGAAEIITCNTVLHTSNQIDVTGLIAENLALLLK